MKQNLQFSVSKIKLLMLIGKYNIDVCKKVLYIYDHV